MIFLWDERVKFLLLSRCDTLKAGTGKAGMPKDGYNDGKNMDGSISKRTLSPIQRRNRKGKNVKKESGILDTMIDIVNLIQSTTTAKEPSQTPSSVSTNNTGVEITLEELNGTCNRYMAHLKCLKDNDLLTPECKLNIVKKRKILCLKFQENMESNVA